MGNRWPDREMMGRESGFDLFVVDADAEGFEVGGAAGVGAGVGGLEDGEDAVIVGFHSYDRA